MKHQKIKQLFATVLLAAFLVSIISVAPVKASPVGLVADWNLDEGTGSIAHDNTGNNNNGILSGGKFGNALEFNGVNSYVEIPDAASLDITGDITIEAWIKINSFSTSEGLHMYVVGKDSVAGRSYGIGVDLTWINPKKPFVIVFDPSGGYQIAWGSTELSTGEWYHIAGVLNTNTLTLYVNGNPQTPQSYTNTIYASSTNLRIGARQYAVSQCFFSGIIDEVRISNVARYTTAFTPSSIAFVKDTNTAGLWHFDESIGTTASDESDYHNDGTISNAKWAGPTWVTGYSGNALNFDGVDDYVSIGNIGVIDDWTVDFEVNIATDSPIIQYPISLGSVSGNTYNAGIFVVFNYEAKKWGIYDGSTYILGSPLSTNTWYNIAVSKAGTTYRLYLNGALENTGTLGNIPITNLQFGRRLDPLDTPYWYFSGMIDEVKIYNYAIDQLHFAFDPDSDTIAPVNTDAHLKVCLTDTSGNTVMGMTVTLESSSGLTLSSTHGVTGADGCYAFTAKSTVAGFSYTITATVSPLLGAALTDTWTLVIYDPSGGFVTGGGWIDSPLGAYAADLTLEGKATFGFVSKYQKGATVPTGNTEFIFHVAGFKFKSTSYDWLVVAGTRAQYKGTGTINGAGDYGFMLTAIDGGTKGSDIFRIKIWDKATSAVVYDNQMGAPDTAVLATSIAGGSIVIHK